MERAVLVEGEYGRGPGRLSALAEAVRASATPWHVRTIESCSREALRAELTGEIESLLLVVVGRELPVETIARELAVVPHSVVVMILDEAPDPGALASQVDGPGRAVFVAVGSTEALLEHLADALRGAACDARCGAVSLASLAKTFLGTTHAVRIPDERRDAPWFFPASLERMWQLGWSSRTVARNVPCEDATADALLGSVLPGRFRVDQVIAAGSFGVVYRGRQLSVGREVAVKVLRTGIEPLSEDGRLFVQEIQTVARIDHPNVVRIHQADITSDGRLFFAMELLDGRDLQLQLGDGPIPTVRALALFRQLLAALDAAHQVGIVHADVKPGNALVVRHAHGERLVLVDFGLARLVRADAATSVGGTPAFMAPEQLRARHVDARSDQFSAALVLVTLLTGWRRTSSALLAPPEEVLNTLSDRHVLHALRRALSIDPDGRFASVAAFSAALEGRKLDGLESPRRPPFHGLASLTEEDRGHLHGRDQALARLTDLVFHRALVIVTAPSGAGKTSLLRAGLIGRLTTLGSTPYYASCRTSDEARLANEIQMGTQTLSESLAPPALGVTLIIDQVEDALDQRDGQAFLEAVVKQASGSTPVHVVLSVREDFLARLLDRLPDRGDGVPTMRVGPLDDEGARAAIERPLAHARLAVEPGLLERLVEDLVDAGTALGDELGWSTPRPVYPPHLQLVCTALYEQLPHGERTLTLDHYLDVGGFGAIVGEHLDRVLGSLTAPDHAIAREVLLALVGQRNLRLTRTEGDLRAQLSEAQASRVQPVLESLRRQGLLVRIRRPDGDLAWEIIHDSLIPRVLAWLDQQDIARRHASEIIRHHLRRADPRTVLSRQELREVEAFPDILDALEREWASRSTGDGPRAMFARSRRLHRRSRIAAVALVGTLVAGLAFAAYQRWRVFSETELRDRNVGRFELELEAFDRDPSTRAATVIPFDELPALEWSLHRPSAKDADLPGEPLPAERGKLIAPDPLRRRIAVEAQGGAAVLVITGRGRTGETCAPSIIPIARLPGYSDRGARPPRMTVHIPTCRATEANTIEIPGGDFIFGGFGEPAADPQEPIRRIERSVLLSSFRIDRTEVTNAELAQFATMSQVTGIVRRQREQVKGLVGADSPSAPATQIVWREARVYCRYLGKDLPSSEEWEKAMRGGKLIGGTPNPQPRRNYPWGTTARGDEANLRGSGEMKLEPVGSFPRDVSPYGVLDLAGNVMEWLRSPDVASDPKTFFAGTTRVVRGGNSIETTPDLLRIHIVLENGREGDQRAFTIGWRCAL
jgi:eukaryotic-like serine/threonine-protein kinase